jgi:hypothetical protein
MVESPYGYPGDWKEVLTPNIMPPIKRVNSDELRKECV